MAACLSRVRSAVITDSSLVAWRWARLPVVQVASPACLRRHGVPASAADLWAHPQFLSARVRAVVDALLAHCAAAADLHTTLADLPAAWQARANLT